MFPRNPQVMIPMVCAWAGARAGPLASAEETAAGRLRGVFLRHSKRMHFGAGAKPKIHQSLGTVDPAVDGVMLS